MNQDRLVCKQRNKPDQLVNSLAPSKYIEFVDHDLDIDYSSEMARIQTEMKAVLVDEKRSQSLLEEAFRGIGYGID